MYTTISRTFSCCSTNSVLYEPKAETCLWVCFIMYKEFLPHQIGSKYWQLNIYKKTSLTLLGVLNSGNTNTIHKFLLRLEEIIQHTIKGKNTMLQGKGNVKMSKSPSNRILWTKPRYAEEIERGFGYGSSF